MKARDRPISSKDVEDLDLFLAEQDFPGESDSQENATETRQYISPTCYGNGWQRCDIQVPRVPQCYMDHEQQASSERLCQGEVIQPLLKWSVLPPNVVQIEGLPTDFDAELLRDLVAHYGTIIKSEVQKTNRDAFFRFKTGITKLLSMPGTSLRSLLNDADSCDWLVTNMHGLDILGSGNILKCSLI